MSNTIRVRVKPDISILYSSNKYGDEARLVIYSKSDIIFVGSTKFKKEDQNIPSLY